MGTNIKNKTNTYKFRIDEILKSMPKNDYERALTEIPKLLNISFRQFQNYRYAKKDDRIDLTSEKLYKLSQYFDCSMKDILNL